METTMTRNLNIADERPPRVTVVMPVYNGEEYLALAIESALGQRFRSFELVIVDDGSTDSSGSIAHAHAMRFPDRIRVIDQANAGLPLARNTALNAGRGEYFALLDADDVWLPDHLQLAMDVFDADPDIGLVHGNIRRIDARGEVLGVPERDWLQQEDAFAALALRHEHVACPTAVFARSCVERVGGFDPQFTGLGCEDRDLWLRIAERFRIHYVDAVVAHYRVHPGGMSRNRERMAAARQRLMNKVSLSARGAPLYREMHAMIQSDLGIELLDEGRWLEAMQAQVRALGARPQTALVWRRLVRSGLQGMLSRPNAGVPAMGAAP